MSDRSEPQLLFDADGRRYVLGDMLAEGGEGTIHELPGHPDVVVKVLNFTNAARRDHGAQELYDKLEIMLARRPRAPSYLGEHAEHPFWAWPERRLQTSDGTFAGYAMPRMQGVKGEEFHQFASGFDWATRMDAARNVAALVVATHDAGYVIGDLNPRNLFFLPLRSAAPAGVVSAASACVLPSVIDTDSFQVEDLEDGAVLFECRVQNPEYSAPELIDGVARDRTRQQDDFTLAIVLFQILTLGVHPFSGIVKGSVNREIRNNIAKRRNVLLSRDLQPPKDMVDLTVLPPPVRALFERTFGPGHLVTGARAPAREWSEVLAETLATGLVVCDRTDRHAFGRHERRCPWCAYAAAVGADPFRPPGDAGARRRRPVSARVIGAGPERGRPQATRASPGRASSAPPPGGGDDDTIFGPVPAALKRGRASTSPAPGGGDDDTIFGPVPSDIAGAASSAPSNERPSPAPPAPPAPGAERAGTAASPSTRVPDRVPRGRPPLPLLVVASCAVLLVSGWFVVGPSGRDAIHATMRQWFGSASLPGTLRGGPTEPVQVPIFTPAAPRGSHSLTIELCVDRVPPFACTADTAPVRGADVVIMGSRGVERRASTTIPGMRVFLASDLPSDRYTLTLVDSPGEDTLRQYVWCDVTDAGDVPVDVPIGIRLDRDRTVQLVLCAR